LRIIAFDGAVPFYLLSNAADAAYSAWPERLYIIDEQGRIAYRGGMGPFHYDPAEVRAWLAQRFGPVKHDTPASSAAAASRPASPSAAPSK
jgi:hypothetical protein